MATSYSSASGSSTGSPAAPYRIVNPRRPDSPGEKLNGHDAQPVLQNLYTSPQQIRPSHSGSTPQALDRLQDHFDASFKSQQLPPGSMDPFASSVFMGRSPPTASSISSTNSISRHLSLNPPFQDNPLTISTSALYNSSATVSSPRVTSPRHLQSSNFDGRAGATLSSFMSGGQKQFNAATQSFGSAAPSFNSPMSSQTPYGPHVPTVASATTNSNAPNPAAREVPQEDISTIFVVGFPDDMQEREFQNMFTFSPGFEAATLKIPSKDYGPYGVLQSRQNGGSFQQNFAGANDPYGAMLNDTARDGQWPSSLSGLVNEDSLQFGNPGVGAPQRKQIIGFAKFRTRTAALEARDFLQGRKVDIEKGAVLKAEMAKKNLHTKRGVGPGGGPGGHTSSSAVLLNNPPDAVNNGDAQNSTAPLWRDTLHGIDRDQSLGADDRRQREVNGNLGMVVGQRGARVRAEELDQRRRQQQQLQPRLRIGHTFDSFSLQRQGSSAGGLMTSSTSGHGFGLADHNIFANAATNGHAPSEEIASWNDVLRSASSTVVASSPPKQSLSRSSPTSFEHNVNGRLPVSQEHIANSISDLTQAAANLTVSGTGETSPQLPSPASGASSNTSMKNMIDQNPPINTLYVGNLPTTPPPTGYPQDHLECSLRDLFSAQPGFRRLCFRQKNNGPMCFVEFEDVHYATRALNDLYGHTLNGLVKGGGIRLSYSKNPLGVRTPNTNAQSAGSGNAEGFNQLQDSQNTRLQQHAVEFEHQGRGDPTSPSTPYSHSLSNFMLGSPPAPRFASSYAGNIFSNTDNAVNNTDTFASSRSVFAPFGTSGIVSDRQNLRAGLDFASRSSIPSSQYRTLPAAINPLEATRAI